MKGWMLVVTLVSWVVIGACLVGQWRLGRVSSFRARLLDDIARACAADYARGMYDYKWRFERYHAASYDRMVFSLRPLAPESFYSDTGFLHPRAGTPARASAPGLSDHVAPEGEAE